MNCIGRREDVSRQELEECLAQAVALCDRSYIEISSITIDKQSFDSLGRPRFMVDPYSHIEIKEENPC